jgi:hypothetical protein
MDKENITAMKLNFLIKENHKFLVTAKCDVNGESAANILRTRVQILLGVRPALPSCFVVDTS